MTRSKYNEIAEQLSKAEISKIPSILIKDKITFEDFLCLIANGSEKYLEKMAQRSRELTRKRFGSNISLYAPLYVSNECVNTCTYCGFSRPNKIARRTLTNSEIEAEAKALSKKGIRNVLLLTGESPKKNPVSYLLEAVRIIKPYFYSVHIEIYPVGIDEYQEFFNAGVEGVTLYQETYDPKIYDKIHTSGFKKDFDYRIDTLERASQSGIRRLTLGALLGLASWRLEMACLAFHLLHLEKTAWRSALSLSFPRIKEAAFYTKPENIITDKEFVLILSAFRILSPNSGINISTRESAAFRDQLIPLGITSMSAGSRTDIGGYSGDANSTEQFSLDDLREPHEVASSITAKGYQPVFKEWDNCL
ncbi:MAG: 2-iminoacetate synthase ThiH [bacterium]|nr:2-iminoacetate synthase ThiH [bacterium]